MIKKLKILSIITAISIASFAAGLSLRPVMVFGAESTGFSTLLQVYDILQTEFLHRDLDDSKLEEGAIIGMVASLNDPYTRYMNKKAFEEMKDERHGEFSGIGIQIGIKHNQITVIAPIEDTPAHKAGLKAGDVILAIDKKSTKNMSLDEAVSLIRGKIGTPVTLTIVRDNQIDKPFDVTIIRATIHTKSVRVKMLPNNIGYLRLSSFMSENAPKEVANGLLELKQKRLNSLILDLRSNPGGLLENAISIGSMFINKGAIVQVVDRNGKKEVFNSYGKVQIPMNMKLVVLIDGGSASASEILAGALKDHKRATLIGLKTFGKGLVQTVHPLANGGGLSVTTNKYLTPNGNDIDKKGIEPDIVVEYPKVQNNNEEEQEYSEENDVHIKKAIEILTK